LVRSRNAKALELEKLGAELCIGNLTDRNDLNNALKDIKRVYYCHPFIPNLLENTKLFIECAKENNIEAIVNLGQWLAEFDNQKSVQTKDIQSAYKEYEQSGLNVIQLIPGFLQTIPFL